MHAATDERKRALIARGRSLRAELMHALPPLGHNLRALESGLRVARRIAQHPEWVVAGVLALAVLRPRRIASWVRGMSSGMRLWRVLAPALRVRAHH